MSRFESLSCPNCGAPYERFSGKCSYCDSYLVSKDDDDDFEDFFSGYSEYKPDASVSENGG